jgi:hypothetical protein
MISITYPHLPMNLPMMGCGERVKKPVIAGNWDELRQAVRATREALGLAIDDVAAAIGHTSSTTRGRLSMRTPPSEAMQGRLRAWVEDMSRAVAPAAGGASQARHGHGQQPTPGPAPPSAGDTRPRMCAPSAKILAPADIVSPTITPPNFEYGVFRLPDHDWRGQGDVLNARCGDGWVLVSVSGGVAYMRRVV